MVVDKWSFRLCVVFLVQSRDRVSKPLATAFVVCEEGPWQFPYLVTARHNLEFADKKQPLFARFNTSEKNFYDLEIPFDTWEHHSTTDVAIAPLDELPGEVQQATSYVPMRALMNTDEVKAKVREGMPVFVPSLFDQFQGKTIMHPIVRSGGLALIPDEKLIVNIGPVNGDQEIDGYLIECFVWGGCSGAPVFVAEKDLNDVSSTSGIGEVRLIGLINGHYPHRQKTKVGEDTVEIKHNAGISIVIPAAAILELFYLPHLVDRRKKSIYHGNRMQ